MVQPVYYEIITNSTMRFELASKFSPMGDQPTAIRSLTGWLQADSKHQTLLGVTGSGKTFTMANIINNLQQPTLIISPNKTLAAQLYGEFKQFFPNNAVHYFVSYYDYYQPEAYIPQSDTYIAKEAMINDEIDRLRHASTQALLTRNDCIIVASVSCIYGLGSPQNYQDLRFPVALNQKMSRQQFLKELVTLQYDRNDLDFGRGTFRVRGDLVEIHPVTGEDIIRFEFFGDNVSAITLLPNHLSNVAGTKNAITLQNFDVYPAKHFVTPLDDQRAALASIREELRERLVELRDIGKDLEAQRLEQRTNYDLELIETTGYCNGIENYSRYFDGRVVDEPPFTLLDYFSYAVQSRKLDGFLTFMDESHISVPQVRGMFAGDRSRKQMLVDYGWRLPCAFDNRPLTYDEFAARNLQTIYVSATPNEYELKLSGAVNGFADLKPGKVRNQNIHVAEQLIRPTCIPDPEVDIRPTDGQLADLEREIKLRVTKGERVLVTTLTKRLSEALTEYLEDQGIKVQYLHSDVETLERVKILKDLRAGVYDVLVGINLLREGLDLPEVSLVAILDADKEGFLRNETTLIQTMGRAARHPQGRVIMYADVMTKSINSALAEVNRRRAIQLKYNKDHNLTPRATERVDFELVSDNVVDIAPSELLQKKKKKDRLPKITRSLRK